MALDHLRNIAIIAHVDHGKTTLVDQLLRQSGTVATHKKLQDRAMDSEALEQERGITILSKCTTLRWSPEGGETYTINVVDTPGHADFGGEVERVLGMVDSVLLLVDAFEGPMPQTRFVLRKSLALGLRPIVVINKIDRPDSRPDDVLNEVFDLFGDLDASDEQLDFPVCYTSAKLGFAVNEPGDEPGDMTPLFEAIIEQAPAPSGDADAPLCMQIATLGSDPFLGRLAIGRIYDGEATSGQDVIVSRPGGERWSGRLVKILRFDGLDRHETKSAGAGEIVVLAGLEDVLPGDTISAPEAPRVLPAIEIEEPTISMRFMVNKSPFAGRDSKYVTSRQLRERLDRALESDVSLRVEDTDSPDVLEVSGRGELHLAILLETMRREGYELAVSQPRVIDKLDAEGKRLEPIEAVVIECGDDYSGTVIDKLNRRRGELQSLRKSGDAMVRLEFRVPARGLIGFRSDFLTDTRGTGTLHSVFDGYAPYRGEVEGRGNGALIAQDVGATTTYALYSLQERGVLFVEPGEEVYGGQIIGEHARDNDLVVNPNKKKQLTNMRASGSDDKLLLAPPRKMGLEAALEWIDSDELVELTPNAVRIRKAELDHSARKRKK